MRNYWKAADDATRCDNVQTATNRQVAPVPLITIPHEVACDPVVSMARRPPLTWTREREVRSRYAVTSNAVGTVGDRDLTLLQKNHIAVAFVFKKLFA